ncbi:hypothetical protein BRC95_05465 [Halobacteriales archaeon QS_5_68_33]|nr:MAG: hypothetical protein BRC95_05465 [Halobacteriales archaeon QS_5_68_33]
MGRTAARDGLLRGGRDSRPVTHGLRPVRRRRRGLPRVRCRGVSRGHRVPGDGLRPLGPSWRRSVAAGTRMALVAGRKGSLGRPRATRRVPARSSRRPPARRRCR